MSHYILDTEVRNEGIKYADAFFVASRYCLVQTGPHRSHLKLTCEVKYVKSLMAIIKCKHSPVDRSQFLIGSYFRRDHAIRSRRVIVDDFSRSVLFPFLSPSLASSFSLFLVLPFSKAIGC